MWLTRFLLLRLLGVVYFAAFLGVALQIVPLVGENGLLPARPFLERVGFWQEPTVFWFHLSDGLLAGLAWAGAGLSLLVVAGFANAIGLFVLWLLYLSYVHVGQVFWGYGWELQLLETGFLAIFLCPLLDPRPFPHRPPPQPVLWLQRWVLVRVMLGAGLIKLRGDACWRDLTCLDTHFETQPIPNPLSPLFHFAPGWLHQAGVLFNHFVELVVPLFCLGPRRVRHVAGGCCLALQVVLLFSGNYSFLNWLTLVPIVACFDDTLLGRVLPRRLVARAQAAAEAAPTPSVGQKIATWILVAGVAVLSIDPIANLFSRRQRMNASFEPFSLVNTYGNFGSVGRERDEIVLEGSEDGETWKAYELPCKPGDPARRPCIVSPYQPRLDWQVWFAAMSSAEREPWFVHLVWKLLHGDDEVRSLFAVDPFPDAPPRFVRAQLYRYRFAPLGADVWWERTLLRPYLPPLAADDPRLVGYLRAMRLIPRIRRADPRSRRGSPLRRRGPHRRRRRPASPSPSPRP